MEGKPSGLMPLSIGGLSMKESERSSNADNLWNTNPDLSTNEILNNIKQGALRSTGGGPSISYMLAPFSALLVKLSKDADHVAEKNLTIANRLYWLTWMLLILTFLLFAKEAVDFYKNDYLPYRQTGQPNQNASVKLNTSCGESGSSGENIKAPSPSPRTVTPQ
jgi:hypothetical protein